MALRDKRRRDPQYFRDQEIRRYARNPEMKKAAARRYYAKNRERILARMSTAAGREQSRNRMRMRLRNPAFRLHSNISRAIRASLKDKNRRPWEKLVGYDLGDLTRHIERQFLPGMKWGNQGRGTARWHIDHIVPRSAFSFSSADDADFKACWSLSNLRPMWSVDNIRKHANRIHLL